MGSPAASPRSPAVGPQGVRAQVPDRSAAGVPAAAAAPRGEQLVELAVVAVDHEDVAVATRAGPLDLRVRRDRVADVVGLVVVVEADGRARRRGGHDLVRDAVAGVRAEVHVQPAIEPDRADVGRRLGVERQRVDALVPDVAGREDRARLGAGHPRRDAGGGGLGGGRARVGPGPDLVGVAEPIAVGVDQLRVGVVRLLLDVQEPVQVGVLAVVADAVAVGVGDAWVGRRALLPEVAQLVPVEVLDLVTDAVAVAVDEGRAGPRLVALVPVGQAVTVRVEVGCRRRSDQDRPGQDEDDQRQRPEAAGTAARRRRHGRSVPPSAGVVSRPEVTAGRDRGPVSRRTDGRAERSRDGRLHTR